MKRLLKEIEKLKKGEIKETIDNKMKEFKELGKSPNEKIFSELCFCILTANFSAEKGIMIQNSMSRDFLSLPESKLAKKLKECGHRYPNIRAKYIVEARKYADLLREMLNSKKDEKKLREWLVKNIKGLGCKEASHFLRNIGFENLAILDFHIINVLVKYGLIEKPKALTKKKYLEVENLLEGLAEKIDLNLAQLDLYLWYMETGKILK